MGAPFAGGGGCGGGTRFGPNIAGRGNVFSRRRYLLHERQVGGTTRNDQERWAQGGKHSLARKPACPCPRPSGAGTYFCAALRRRDEVRPEKSTNIPILHLRWSKQQGDAAAAAGGGRSEYFSLCPANTSGRSTECTDAPSERVLLCLPQGWRHFSASAATTRSTQPLLGFRPSQKREEWHYLHFWAPSVRRASIIL